MPIALRIRTRLILLLAACAATCLPWHSATLAQNFPAQPLRIVAATPPGGAADINARRLADRLSKLWKQPVVVRNLSGGAPAVTALIGGEVQLLFDATATAIGHLRGGRVRALAIASLKRSAVLPDIATFEEGGLRGFESVIAHGILVPAKTPAAMVTLLNRTINETLNDPDYKKQMAEFGAELIGGSATEFRAFLAAERTKWANLIRKQGIKANY